MAETSDEKLSRLINECGSENIADALDLLAEGVKYSDSGKPWEHDVRIDPQELLDVLEQIVSDHRKSVALVTEQAVFNWLNTDTENTRFYADLPPDEQDGIVWEAASLIRHHIHRGLWDEALVHDELDAAASRAMEDWRERAAALEVSDGTSSCLYAYPESPYRDGACVYGTTFVTIDTRAARSLTIRAPSYHDDIVRRDIVRALDECGAVLPDAALSVDCPGSDTHSVHSASLAAAVTILAMTGQAEGIDVASLRDICLVGALTYEGDVYCDTPLATMKARAEAESQDLTLVKPEYNVHTPMPAFVKEAASLLGMRRRAASHHDALSHVEELLMSRCADLYNPTTGDMLVLSSPTSTSNVDDVYLVEMGQPERLLDRAWEFCESEGLYGLPDAVELGLYVDEHFASVGHEGDLVATVGSDGVSWHVDASRFEGSDWIAWTNEKVASLAWERTDNKSRGERIRR